MAVLTEIISSFEMLEPNERLEWLIEFGNSLPALPEAYHAERNAGKHIVHECQAPVFFKVELLDDQVQIQADVPREAPVARGFVSLLKQTFDGLSLAEKEAAPDDMLEALHLKGLLGMQRTRGLTAIYNTLKTSLT